jgi:hypothetical protein
VHDHLTDRREDIEIPAAASGHGGGDFGIVRSFIHAVRGDGEPLTTGRESLESHLMAFAAEESRISGAMIRMDDYRATAETAGQKA